MSVGILHLATLIDSVVRRAGDNGGGGDGVGLVPAKSRVKQLKAKALSTAAAAAVAADSTTGAAAGETAAATAVPVVTTAMPVEGDPFSVCGNGRPRQVYFARISKLRLLFLLSTFNCAVYFGASSPERLQIHHVLPFL